MFAQVEEAANLELSIRRRRKPDVVLLDCFELIGLKAGRVAEEHISIQHALLTDLSDNA